MKKRFLEPDLVNLTLVLVFTCLIYFWAMVLICYGQECKDGVCPPRDISSLRVNWRAAGTTDGRKHPAVVRMEHDDYKGRGYFTGVLVVAPNALRMNIVITAAHAFEGPGETRVYISDGRVLKGKILELDHLWDIGIVRVEGSGLSSMRLATEPPGRGDPITAYGYGWVGKQYTRMQGVALGYSLFKGQRVANTLKCSFNSRDGDSGGPMVNSRCEVAAIISCRDDQSGTYGTWAARIKVIMDRAIAREINKVDLAKEDTGRLPPPHVAQRVAPPVAGAGAASGRAKLTAINNKTTNESRYSPHGKTKVQAPSTGLGLPAGSTISSNAALPTLFDGLPVSLFGGFTTVEGIATFVALLTGVGLTGGVGWGGYAALKTLLAIYRRRKGKAAVSSADSFSTLPREAKEARQLLQLSELEGRSPLFDAIIGRLTFDELNNAIDGNRPEKDYALKLKEKLLRRFNEIAPVSVEQKYA